MNKGSKGVMDVGKLVSCSLIEMWKDDSQMWLWSYPSVPSELKTIISSKGKIIWKDQDNGNENMPHFFHWNNLWVYLHFMGNLPEGFQGSGIGAIITTADFQPELYEKVASVMCYTYVKKMDVTLVLQQFLSLVVQRNCVLPKKKTFSLDDFSSVEYTQHSVKGIISTFGLETILIHTGIFREKRIVVYHHDIRALVGFALSLPFLRLKQKGEMWDAVYPWIDVHNEDINYLKEQSFYILGCPQAEVESRQDLYDIFINIPAAEISISPHAKEDLQMNKAHKELATFIVKLATNQDLSDAEIIDSINKRSMEIFDKLSKGK